MPRSRGSSFDSLFSGSGSSFKSDDVHIDGVNENPSGADAESIHSTPASRVIPPIPGLYVFPSLLADHVANTALRAIGQADLFSGGTRDQVMLFEAPKRLSNTIDEAASQAKPTISALPNYVRDLHDAIQELIVDQLTNETAQLLFSQPLARQVILNLYPPGEGISPHVDLPNRYADGIIGCSLTGGCVMTLTKNEERYDVYMPPRTIYVLSGEARWSWAHGIQGRLEDIVVNKDGKEETMLRDLRVSATFRWMKEGADVLS